MSTSLNEPIVQLTLTDELQDNLNNIEISQDRIRVLINVLSARITGEDSNCGSLRDPRTNGKSVAGLNSQARDLALDINELGDKLASIVNRL